MVVLEGRRKRIWALAKPSVLLWVYAVTLVVPVIHEDSFSPELEKAVGAVCYLSLQASPLQRQRQSLFRRSMPLRTRGHSALTEQTTCCS